LDFFFTKIGKKGIIVVQGGGYMLIDIIFILLVIIVAVIGYKVGFLTTLLKLTSALSGLIIAICLTEPITNVAVEWGLDNPIEEKVFTNITTSEAFLRYTEGGEGIEGINSLLQELGIPSFISGFIAEGVAEIIDPVEIAREIASTVSHVAIFIIIFIFLLIFSSLIFWILKLVVKTVRKTVGFFRVLDGTFGILFYLCIFMIIFYLILLIISLILPSVDPNSGFATFLAEQLHLEDDAFGIVKYLYQNNIIGNFFGLLL
jgi:hypothetical protein